MIEHSRIRVPFASISGKRVEADFTGGTVTSDGGALLLHAVDSQMGVITRMISAMRDRRHPSYIDHTMLDLVKQRVFQIACGYEDAVDCDELRHDPAIKAACGRLPLSGSDLASQSTMTRLENDVRRSDLYRLAQAFVDGFIASYKHAPNISSWTSMTQTTRHTVRNSIHFSTRITMNTALCRFIFMKAKAAS